MDATLGPLETAEAVVFDFDGTLVELAVDWAAARREMRAVLAQSCPGLAAGLGLQAMIDAAVAAGCPGARRLAATVLAAYEATAVARPIVPVLEVFSRLLPVTGLAVVSNNLHDTVARHLRALGLDTAAFPIVGFDDVGRSKPDPEGLRLVLGRLGVHPKRCVSIGDAASDQAAAQAAGCGYLSVQAICNRRQTR